MFRCGWLELRHADGTLRNWQLFVDPVVMGQVVRRERLEVPRPARRLHPNHCRNFGRRYHLHHEFRGSHQGELNRHARHRCLGCFGVKQSRCFDIRRSCFAPTIPFHATALLSPSHQRVAICVHIYSGTLFCNDNVTRECRMRANIDGYVSSARARSSRARATQSHSRTSSHRARP